MRHGRRWFRRLSVPAVLGVVVQAIGLPRLRILFPSRSIGRCLSSLSRWLIAVQLVLNALPATAFAVAAGAQPTPTAFTASSGSETPAQSLPSSVTQSPTSASAIL